MRFGDFQRETVPPTGTRGDDRAFATRRPFGRELRFLRLVRLSFLFGVGGDDGGRLLLRARRRSRKAFEVIVATRRRFAVDRACGFQVFQFLCFVGRDGAFARRRRAGNAENHPADWDFVLRFPSD